VLASAALLGLAGCRGGDWIVAGAEGAVGGDAGGEALPPADVLPVEECRSAATMLEQRAEMYRPEAVAEGFAGRWRGTLRGDGATGFPSANVELELDAAGQGSFGFDGSPPPLVTDPQSGYLCSAGADGAVLCGSRSGFVGGFRYPLERVTVRGDVLSFVLVEADPWGPWCEQRQPVAWPNPVAECDSSFDVQLPGADTVAPTGCSRTDDEGAVTDIDCELMYTLRHCDCGWDACIAAYEGGGIEVGLELGEGGAALTGSLWYSGDLDAARLRLER
jgi:hypothetical protein